jgi:hypothetical protein
MQSPASKKFLKSSLSIWPSYFVLFGIADYVVYRLHPTGAVLWLLAAMPVLPVVVFVALLGRYLHEERDGYKRDLAIRYLLWGTAGAVTVNMLFGHLRIFGWKGQMFPFAEFFVFVIMMLLAKISYRIANPVPVHE